MPQLTVCPSCAERLDPDDKFCGNCGTNLAVPGPAGAPPARPAPQTPGADTGDYGLAPPAPAHAPRVPAPGGPQAPADPAPAAAAPLPGVADPRAELLAPERRHPDPTAAAPAACVACGTGAVDADGYCENCGHAQPRQRDHVEEELPGAVAAVTDRGLRHHRNEDAFAVAATTLPDGTPAAVAVVCDGVSSASRPDEASAVASETARGSLVTALARGTEPRQAMHEALLTAAESVNSLAGNGPSAPNDNAPACTCVGAVTSGDLLTVGWIGDSRAYWIPDDRTGEWPARLTEDDSWAARMVEAGLMSQEEANADPRAHAITGWLGADAEELDPHTASFQPDRPGVVVVCTDGLWNYADSAEELAAVVPPDARTRPLSSARALVGVALDGGGHDNITVAVLPFPAPGREPSEERQR